MSHFALLVVTDELPTDEVLHRTLQPYHEYECTGIRDQYVRFVDCTDEVKKEWETKTEERWRNDNTGELKDPYDDLFYREFTAEELEKIGHKPMGSGCSYGVSWNSQDWKDGYGYRAKVHLENPPIGFSKVDVPLSKNYPSMVEYAKDYHGYEVDETGRKIGHWTNPDKKWDWWTVGGRYSERLTLKDGREVDSAQVGEIDLDAMRSTRKKNTYGYLEEGCAEIIKRNPEESLTKERILELWAGAINAIKIARESWEALGRPGIFRKHLEEIASAQPFRDAEKFGVVQQLELFHGFPDDEPDLIKYIENLAPLSCFAFLKDGKWFEQGSMGWWGCVNNEDKVSFSAAFDEMFKNLKPEQYIAFVDCHI